MALNSFDKLLVFLWVLTVPVADLFLFFMLSLSDDNKCDVIEAFNSTSRYLDDRLNSYNNFFDSMVNHIYP